jgi:hypothetical protein
MPDQFSNDEKGGKQRAVVHIWAVALDPSNSPEFAARVADLMREVCTELDGFLGGQVFEADDGTSVTAITSWETRHLWAKALWDQRVGLVVASVQLGEKKLDVMCYERATIVPAGSRLPS